MCLNKQGFIFIETIIVICVLTVGLMSLYNNYSKIVKNTKELNTYDIAEYNYKTYFLKKYDYGPSSENTCQTFSDYTLVKICKLTDVSENLNKLTSSFSNLDAYIIDYINSQDLTTDNDNLFIAEFKKEDKQNKGEYLTYISSLTY